MYNQTMSVLLMKKNTGSPICLCNAQMFKNLKNNNKIISVKDLS